MYLISNLKCQSFIESFVFWSTLQVLNLLRFQSCEHLKISISTSLFFLKHFSICVYSIHYLPCSQPLIQGLSVLKVTMGSFLRKWIRHSNAESDVEECAKRQWNQSLHCKQVTSHLSAGPCFTLLRKLTCLMFLAQGVVEKFQNKLQSLAED